MGKKKSKKSKKSKPAKIDTRLLERQGDASFKEGNYADAVSRWNRLLKLRGGIKAPINQTLLPKLAQAYFLSREHLPPAQQEDALKWSCIYDPTHTEYLAELLVWWRTRGKLAKACEFIAELHSRYPHLTPLKHIEAVLVALGGDEKKLATLLEQIHPETATRLMALVRFKRKSKPDAFRTLERRQYPSAPSRLAVATMLLACGQHDKAYQELSRLRDQAEGLPAAMAQLYLAMDALQHNGDVQQVAGLAPALEVLGNTKAMLLPKRRQRLATLFHWLGVQAANSQDFTKAVAFWRRAYQLAPPSQSQAIEVDLTRGLSLLAKWQAEDGKLEEAIKLWEELLQTATHDPGVQKNLALAYERLGKIDEAITFWENTVKTWFADLGRSDDPIAVKRNIVLAYRQLAECYERRREWDKVAYQYRCILKLAPQDMEIKSKLAEYCLDNDNLDEAFTLLEELLEVEPRNSHHFTNMGIAYQLCGKLEEAIKWWEEAVKLNDPPDVTAIEMLAGHYEEIAIKAWEQGQLDKAWDWLHKKLVVRPQHSRTLQLLAALAMEIGRSQKAQEYMKQALATSPDDPHMWINIGELLLRHNQPQKAARHFRKAEKLRNENFFYDDALMYIGLAYCRACSGQKLFARTNIRHCPAEPYCQTARRYLNLAIEVGDQSMPIRIADKLEDLGCSHLLYYAKTAVKMAPYHVLSYTLYAMALFREGDYDQASEVIAQALSMPQLADEKWLVPLLLRMEDWIQYAQKEKPAGPMDDMPHFPW